MTKYQKYAEYKDSGVEALGLIPKGWSILRGKFLFKEINERSESGEETLLSVSEYYGVKPREEKIADGDFLTRAESLEGYKKCYPNDLVMNIMLAWKRGLGVSKYEGIVSPAYSVFRFSEQVNSDYIHYLLRTEEYTKYFKTRSTGIIDSRLRLYPESFGDIFILFPTLEIQTQIANFLDYETAKIDTLIAKQEELIALLKEKRQAVISHAVTKGLNPNVAMKDSGSLWTTQIPSHWKLTKLTYVARIGNGATPSRDNEAYWKDGSIGWINSSKVNDVIITEADQFITPLAKNQTSVQVVQPTDLVMAITGEGQTRGRIAICQLDATINQHLASIRITDKNLNHEFLFYWLTANYERIRYESTGTGSTKGAITCGDIGLYPVPLPPYQEQLEIVASIKKQSETFKSLVAKAESAIQLMQERRIALISAAVTGKIDVRHHASRPTGNYKMQTEVV
ncbi:restriction endonuclease subunit S [uncultured Acinetobacter sp.]|uniref:restriction endonuclease subunit S n=1 Tax=uncultured Acinetobacter sp. TaxID=165433 RepID=UPI0025852180|nr:restriction endonuclease subunit S [uncultured Acinetobacter sp.]